MPKVLSTNLIQEVFIDYIKGMTVEDIGRRYKNEISTKSIYRLIKERNWDDCKKQIDENVEEKTIKVISEAKAKMLNTIAYATNVSNDLVKEQIEDYLIRKMKNKKAKVPAFLPKNLRELTGLLEILGEKWEKLEPFKSSQTNIYGAKVQIQNNQQNVLNATPADDKTLDNLLLDLSQMAGDKVMSLSEPKQGESFQIEAPNREEEVPQEVEFVVEEEEDIQEAEFVVEGEEDVSKQTDS